MKLNKKVIDSITVCGLCAMLTVTAVTNSGRSEVKAEDKVLANTGLEHTGYNSYAGVAATLFDYEKGLTAENAVTVEKKMLRWWQQHRMHSRRYSHSSHRSSRNGRQSLCQKLKNHST